MKLDKSDRRLLATLGSDPAAVASLADALDRSTDELDDRLAALADNGLVQVTDDDRYRRTESGRRLLRTAGGRMDEAIDTDPDIEAVIAAADLGPEAADAVRAAYTFLRYWGQASSDEIVDAVYPEWPAGTDSPDGWWQTIGQALAEVPDIARVDGNSSAVELWRYAGTPEASTPDSDGFLPAERHGRPKYGSVTHAIESMDLSAEERHAVRSAFAVLRRCGTASEVEISEAAFDEGAAGYETVEELWRGLVADAFERLPGVTRDDGDRWRYDLPPTD